MFTCQNSNQTEILSFLLKIPNRTTRVQVHCSKNTGYCALSPLFKMDKLENNNSHLTTVFLIGDQKETKEQAKKPMQDL